MKIRQVYVAGPYTNDDPWEAEQNALRAEALGYEVMKLGGCWPQIPHSNTRHKFVKACTYRQAIEGTLEWMRRCDAVIFTVDWERSAGAQGEYAEAKRIGLPMFFSVDELAKWLRQSGEVSA